MNDNNQNRKKICEDIDERIIVELDIIFSKTGIPRSRICEEAIRYILRQQISPLEKKATRDDITLTINEKLWGNFKDYVEKNNYKIVHLLETGLKYVIRKYKTKIKNGYL